jgi:hypothetical protein
MGLNFIGEMGVYFPALDAIKLTASDGDRVVDCYVQRSALDALGCPAAALGAELVQHLQAHRDSIEIAAMVKYRRALSPTVQLRIEATDLAVILPAAAA